jgi:CRISPR-associated protein Csm1
MQFALDFHRELLRFTNANPSISLSGGIVLANPSLPVRSIVEEAEIALDAAKARENKSKKIIKNAVSVFGVTVDWDEYEQCLVDGRKIIEYLDDGTLSAGLVYRMIDFANRATKQEQISIRDLLWISNFRYTVARNIKDEEVKRWFSRFGTPDTMAKSRIAVSYALYAERHSL